MHAKVKSPFDSSSSALRATNANIVDPAPLVGTLAQLGEPLYFCLPPTGYSDRADAWLNTGVLFARINIATSLAANKLGGVKIATPPQDLALTLGSPDFQRR